VALDPSSLPRDAETLRKIVVDLAEQLDRSLAEQNKYQTLLRSRNTVGVSLWRGI
jgi:hypothetical protein